ncbi:MAG: hypothetical protein GY816_08445 [Cytophagales bacterium]|nr:hypothetical protein [Cytophagales bacterium]
MELGLKDINKSILLNPNNGWAYRNKRIYFSKIGVYDRAFGMFNRAKDTHEFIDELYYFIGKTYLEMGNSQKACEVWKEGLNQGERRCEAMATACGD